jgi:AraC-like DNA-binding protein
LRKATFSVGGNIMKDYLYDPLNENVLLLHTISCNYRSIFHRHNGYEVYLFLQGNVNFYFEQYCYKLTRGNILVIRPDEFHRAVCLDSSLYERAVINLKLPYIEQFSTPQTVLHRCFSGTLKERKHIAVLSEPDINEFLTLIQNIKKVVHSMKYGDDIMTRNYISNLLILVNKAIQKDEDALSTNIMPKLISDIIELIESNITDTITLTMLSDKLFLNGTYISRKFKHSTGLTLQQYIVEKRIALAKRYLLEGQSVTDSCFQSGFNNYSNFIRTFTKQTGISPGKYKTTLASTN